ncbi:hypothetical protein AVEN_253034-1 [Araneus ventricosus]|uniref:Uncharacterized protein n=1 Tax=Araneus ventricosus TaxID=182803 RepID=A0A4Y2H9Y5_ARAVE|nr:hypothetical protein AVEN_253034-1 [Araneus ventricosus]
MTSKTLINLKTSKRSAVLENHRITISELSEEGSISYVPVLSLLTKDLSMRRVSTKFVPELLSADEKEDRFSTSFDLPEYAKNEGNFLKMIVTRDGSLAYGYN